MLNTQPLCHGCLEIIRNVTDHGDALRQARVVAIGVVHDERQQAKDGIQELHKHKPFTPVGETYYDATVRFEHAVTQRIQEINVL